MLTPLAYLLLQMPYVNSTKAKERFRQRKKNRFREVLSARIDLKKQNKHSEKLHHRSLRKPGSLAPAGHIHTQHTVTVVCS